MVASPFTAVCSNPTSAVIPLVGKVELSFHHLSGGDYFAAAVQERKGYSG